MILWPLFIACAPIDATWLMTAHGVVVDADRQPIVGAEVSFVRSDDDGGWESGDTGGVGVLMGTAVTGEDGRFHLPVQMDVADVSVPIAAVAKAEGFRDGLSWVDLHLRDPAAPEALWLGPGQELQTYDTRLPPITVVRDEADSDASWGQGSLYQCETGEPVPRAQFTLRAGWNAPTSRQIEATGFSDGDGVYTVSGLPAGVYTAEVEPGSGYTASRFPVLLTPSGALEQRAAVASALASGQFTVCLSWPEPSLELDLHLTGPLASSDDRFHIYDEESEHPPKEDLVAEILIPADGLEAARVYELRDGDVYRISVYDDSQLSSAEALPASRALLQVWTEGGSWIASPSPGYEGLLWRALELDPVTGEIFRLQEYDDVTDLTNNIEF